MSPHVHAPAPRRAQTAPRAQTNHSHSRRQTNGADALEETLSRLSKKVGVKATIALDRSSGAILKTAGQISLVHTSKSRQQQQQDQPQQQQATTQTEDPSAAAADSETQGAEELAGMVWAFVNAAGGLVEGMDTDVSCDASRSSVEERRRAEHLISPLLTTNADELLTLACFRTS